MDARRHGRRMGAGDGGPALDDLPGDVRADAPEREGPAVARDERRRRAAKKPSRAVVALEGPRNDGRRARSGAEAAADVAPRATRPIPKSSRFEVGDTARVTHTTKRFLVTWVSNDGETIDGADPTLGTSRRWARGCEHAEPLHVEAFERFGTVVPG